MLAGVQPFSAQVAEALDVYCQEHSSQPPRHLQELKEWTAEHFEVPECMSSTLQAQFFIFMASDRQAKRVLDIGSFSGYSALAWKEGMKAWRGEVYTLENDPVMVEACKKTFSRYDEDGRIHLMAGPATQSLRKLEGSFDIIYLDANKAEYIEYLDTILEQNLLANTGVIVADDAVCRGLVADSTDNNYKSTDQGYRIKAERMHIFNEYAVKDPRVDVFLLPAFDGLSMIKLKT